jgi:hypothetical protein
MSGLTPDRQELPPEIDTSGPHSARVYDYLLGGENHFEADRALADQVLQAAPHSRTSELENRQFPGRVVGPAGHPHPPGRSEGTGHGVRSRSTASALRLPAHSSYLESG